MLLGEGWYELVWVGVSWCELVWFGQIKWHLSREKKATNTLCHKQHQLYVYNSFAKPLIEMFVQSIVVNKPLSAGDKICRWWPMVIYGQCCQLINTDNNI